MASCDANFDKQANNKNNEFCVLANLFLNLHLL